MINVYPGSVSAGNLVNSGRMTLEAEPTVGTRFSVANSLINNGFLQLGNGTTGPPGPATTIGTFTNNGSFLANQTSITLTNQPAGITNIGAGSRLELDASSIQAGGGSAFANLTTIDGTLYFYLSPQTITITPQNTSRTLAISSTGSLTFIDGQSWTVQNLTNLGTVFTGADERTLTANVLNVTGTLANGGSMMLLDSGRPSMGDSLNVGSHVTGATVPGYHQFSDGILDELVLGPSSYGSIDVIGPASLSGTLDVLLENGFTPTVGEQFTILTFTPGQLTGAFDSLLNPYFAVTYDNAGGRVVVTAEATPEPASWVLLGLGAFGLFGYAGSRSRQHRRKASG